MIGQSLPHRLLQSLKDLPQPRRYLVAFSGGLDSTTLLHCLHRLEDSLPAEVHAIHVDHGLNERSRYWAAHCRDLCRDWGVPFHDITVNARARLEQGPEAAARHARYEAFARFVDAGDMLLTAHHQDDQAETLLLQLCRGAGVHGLASMPRCRAFGAGWLGRPLLGVPRAMLSAYAKEQGLRWVDDPSNFDTGLQRNFLRHQVLPLLADWRPAIGRVLSRSASHLAEAASLLDVLALQDMVQASGCRPETLSVEVVRSMEPARARNLLRFWLRRQGLALPDTGHLQRILDELITAASDAQPLVDWTGVQVRRYRDDIFAMAPLPPVPGQVSRPWTEARALTLAGLGVLQVRMAAGEGLCPSFFEEGRISVRFRRGGERCRLASRRHTREVKKLLQERGMPPWERARLPLIFVDEELAAIPGLGVCSAFAVSSPETGVVIEWQPVGIENRRRNNDN